MSIPTASIFALFDLNECNGYYYDTVIARAENLAALKGCNVIDLTMKEVISCIEAAQIEYNEFAQKVFASKFTANDARAHHVGALQ